MSFVNQFGKLFNRKAAAPETQEGADPLDAAMVLDNSPLREAYQADAMNSVQGEPDASRLGEVAPADEDLVTLPVLGSATAAQHQRRLFALAGVGAVVLALIAGWVLQQAERSL